MQMQKSEKAALVLADGTIFHGRSIGAAGAAVGEVVFNTAITGYQEILTDPSYKEQIVTLTYPHVGNVGAYPEDQESGKIQVAGFVLREVPRQPSNWRSRESLTEYLKRHNVVAIADIDTRRLTYDEAMTESNRREMADHLNGIQRRVLREHFERWS